MKFFILTMSCHVYADRRKGVRSTWFKRLPSNMTGRIFVGDGPRVKEPGVVQLMDEPDGWFGLSYKLQAAMRYALDYEWDYLFRLDDDTYFVPERLESVVGEATLDQLYPVKKGGTRDPLAGEPAWIGSTCRELDFYSYGGAGYLLARWCVEKLVAQDVRETPGVREGEDDSWVSASMRRFARLYVTDRLQPTMDKRPAPDNNLVTCHKATTSARMRQCHKHFLAV